MNSSTLYRMKSGLFLLYLALLAWLPLPLGSKLPWAVSVMEIWIYTLSILVTLLFCIQPDLISRAFRMSYAAILLFLMVLFWVGVQCIPLPSSWVEILSPHAWLLHQQALLSDNSQLPLTLDLNISLLIFQKTLALFLLFCLTLTLVDNKKRLKQTAYVIVISALIQALVGTFTVFTMDRSMFLNEYTYSIMDLMVAFTDRVRGTFTNPDHLAGYLEMALALGIGLMISMLRTVSFKNWKQRLRHHSQTALSPKAILRGTLIIICIALVMTHSRMGNSAFFFSLFVSGVIFLLLTRHAPRPVTLFLTSMIILDIVIIGSWFGVEKVVHRIESTSLASESRDEFLRDSLPMLHDYSLTGVGAGNYFSSFPAYKQWDIYFYVNHAHNDYLQMLIELGIIGCIPLAMLILLSLWHIIIALRTRHSTLLLGMSFASLMGMTAILLHSTVDFNMQIPSNAALFTLLLALPFICRHMKTH